MRGQGETYGMGAGASVRKGKTAKQVRRARKAIDAKAKTGSSKVDFKKVDATSSKKDSNMGSKTSTAENKRQLAQAMKNQTKRKTQGRYGS